MASSSFVKLKRDDDDDDDDDDDAENSSRGEECKPLFAL